MTVAHAGKAITDVVNDLVKTFEDGANLQADPTATTADYEAWQARAARTLHDSHDSFSSEAEAELREKFTYRRQLGAMDRHHAELQFEGLWNDVRKRAEAIRKAPPSPAKVVAAGKNAFSLLTGAAVGSAAIFAAVFGIVAVTHKPDEESQRAADLVRLTHDRLVAQRMTTIALQRSDFNLLAGTLLTAPRPAPGMVPAAAVTLPPRLVPLAALPVRVADHTETGQTYVASVAFADFYEKAPPRVRAELDDAAPPPLSEPADANPADDCFHTDCLGAIDKEFPDYHLKKDYTITNGDGTASISVSIDH